VDTQSCDTTDLKKWALGDKTSQDKLFALIYQHFKAIVRDAKRKLNGKDELNITADIICSTTALVHDAYIKLAPGITENIDNRKQFYLLVSKLLYVSINQLVQVNHLLIKSLTNLITWPQQLS